MHRWVSAVDVFGVQIYHNKISYRFSRKILWMKIATTNRVPSVILGYYAECIGKLNGESYICYLFIMIEYTLSYNMQVYHLLFVLTKDLRIC